MISAFRHIEMKGPMGAFVSELPISWSAITTSVELTSRWLFLSKATWLVPSSLAKFPLSPCETRDFFYNNSVRDRNEYLS